VHYAGRICDMKKIMEVAQGRKLLVWKMPPGFWRKNAMVFQPGGSETPMHFSINPMKCWPAMAKRERSP